MSIKNFKLLLIILLSFLDKVSKNLYFFLKNNDML